MIILRLMTKAEVAADCSFSSVVLERQCEVQLMRFGDRRLQRRDRFKLNNWIESQKTRAMSNLKTMAIAFWRENHPGQECFREVLIRWAQLAPADALDIGAAA